MSLSTLIISSFPLILFINYFLFLITAGFIWIKLYWRAGCYLLTRYNFNISSSLNNSSANSSIFLKSWPSDFYNPCVYERMFLEDYKYSSFASYYIDLNCWKSEDRPQLTSSSVYSNSLSDYLYSFLSPYSWEYLAGLHILCSFFREGRPGCDFLIILVIID